MAHAKLLRVIGQSLEVAKLPAFELDTDGTRDESLAIAHNKNSQWRGNDLVSGMTDGKIGRVTGRRKKD